jgi:hypothetical protein
MRHLLWLPLLAGCYDFNALGKSPCSDPGTICADFEAGIDTTTWTVATTIGSTASADNTQKHGGTSSLHVHLPAVPPIGAPFVKAELATVANVQANPDLFMRIWIYVPHPAPSGSVRVITLNQPGVPSGSNLGFTLKDGLLSVADNVTQPDTTMLTTSTVALPTDSWHCVMLHINANQIDGYLDGTQPRDLIAQYSGSPNPPLSRGVLGLSYQSRMMATATDLWIDDVVIDPKDPGCGP